MDLRTQYYALDRGLDSMSLLDEMAPGSLPAQSNLVPPQLRYPAQLQQLLNKPDLNEFLANAFLLPTGDAVLSGPSQFAAALEDAQAELQALLGGSPTAPPQNEAPSAKPPPALSPSAQRLVQRAGRVLERESGLRADLASYRSALLKG